MKNLAELMDYLFSNFKVENSEEAREVVGKLKQDASSAANALTDLLLVTERKELEPALNKSIEATARNYFQLHVYIMSLSPGQQKKWIDEVRTYVNTYNGTKKDEKLKRA